MLIGQADLVTEDNFPRLLERTDFLQKPLPYKKTLIREIFYERPLTCIFRIAVLFH